MTPLIYRLLLAGCFLSQVALGQNNVGIGTISPDASARLEINAPDKGVLIPRISLPNVTAAAPVTSPATGLLIYNTNAATSGGSGVGFYYWDGAQWQKLIPGNEGWKLSGNNGTNPSTHFIGTTDNQSLAFRVNNLPAGRIDNSLQNVFLGFKTGINTAPTNQFDGRWNTFVGDSAGLSNTNGNSNSFFGKDAGFGNTSGAGNSIFGYEAGRVTNGNGNSFFGYLTGFNNTTGVTNSFFGFKAGQNNTTGLENCFYGGSAGALNTTGNENTSLGRQAGFSNTTGSYSTYIGGHAGHNALGTENAFLGDSAGALTTTGNQNVFVGRYAGATNTTGTQNLAVGYGADLATNNLTNAVAIGTNAQVNASNSMVLGSINGTNGATADMKVGIGTTTPLYRLHVVNSKTNDGGFLNGIVVENTSPLATAGEAAISFKTAATNNNYWVVGINQAPSLVFNYGTTLAGSTSKVSIDTLGNVGIGTTAPTQKLDVAGAIRVSGEVLRTSTGGANMVPICYGNITSTGSIDSGTPNFTVAHTNGTGLYTVTITGEPYSFISYSTVVTSIGLSPVIIATFSSGGNLQIRLFNTSNASVDSDFNFVVYKN